ncbi:MAG: hypothetical protein NZZ41_06885 [Candidatus Dojkabacteria bacterium]|nr:hypothetical protein [Candidatus Dojkabacteria bacterium]
MQFESKKQELIYLAYIYYIYRDESFKDKIIKIYKELKEEERAEVLDTVSSILDFEIETKNAKSK